MDLILESAEGIWLNYGLFVWAGLLGSLTYCVSHPKMGFRDTVGHVIQSIFIGALVGIGFRELTEFNNDLVFVVSAASCYFSNSIIREARESIDKISDYFDKKVKD